MAGDCLFKTSDFNREIGAFKVPYLVDSTLISGRGLIDFGHPTEEPHELLIVKESRVQKGNFLYTGKQMDGSMKTISPDAPMARL